MELTDLIVMIIGFVFFVLPSVFRGLGKKKPSPKKKKKRVSLFSKLGEGVQTFLQELEQQAKQARQNSGAEVQQETFWDKMEEGDSEIDVTQIRPAQKESEDKSAYDPLHAALNEKIAVSSMTERNAPSLPPIHSVPTETKAESGRTPLQNAVIWTEILGKPVALKEDHVIAG